MPVAEERAPFTPMWMRMNNQQNLRSPSRKQTSATDISTGNTISRASALRSCTKQAVYMMRKLFKLTDIITIHKLWSQQIFKEEFQYISNITRTCLAWNTPSTFSGGLSYFMPLPQHCLKCTGTQVPQLIVLIIQIGSSAVDGGSCSQGVAQVTVFVATQVNGNSETWRLPLMSAFMTTVVMNCSSWEGTPLSVLLLLFLEKQLQDWRRRWSAEILLEYLALMSQSTRRRRELNSTFLPSDR